MSDSPTGTPIIDPGGIVVGFVQTFMAMTQTPGVVVALWYGGQQYFYSYGYADRDTKTLAGELTTFELGSVTKVFTATLVAYELGDLTQPVTNYLPGSYVPNIGLSNVTLLQLLTHTSGMPDQIPGQPGEQLFNGDTPTSSLISWWEKFPANSPAPGTCWRYSNIGFVTLGFAVEDGQANLYNTALLDVITGPLYMTQTSHNPLGAVATGYIGSATKTKRAPGTAFDLKSTSWDMMQFLINCISPPVGPLGDAILKTQTPQVTSSINECDSGDRINFQMGMAWQISPMASQGNDYSLAWKDGLTSLGGFTSWIGFVPNTIGIVLLANKVITSGKTPPLTLGKTGRCILQTLMDLDVSA
jgi:beta-lactamase class C